MPQIEHAIDLSEIEISSPEPSNFECLPPGKYRVLISQADYKTTSRGDGKRIPLTLSVLGGEYAGRLIFEGLNVENPNATAQLIGRQRLKEILDAVNIKDTDFRNTDLIEGEIVVAHVVRNLVKDPVEREKYGDKNGNQNSVSRFSADSKSNGAPPPITTDAVIHDDDPFS